VKIRAGFVSNSSSSSFVVAFPTIPHSVEEIKQLLFADKEIYSYEFSPKDESYTTQRVSETVASDMMSQSPVTYDEIVETIRCGHVNGMPEFDYPSNLSQKDYHKWCEEHDKLCYEFAKKTADEFIKQNKGKYFYIFHYADEDGSYGSALEHGPLFDKMPCLAISNH
jgi:hypothetical protein